MLSRVNKVKAEAGEGMVSRLSKIARQYVLSILGEIGQLTESCIVGLVLLDFSVAWVL